MNRTKAGRIVNDALFPERLADALHDCTVSLTIDNEGIDTTSDVVNRGVAGKPQIAGVGVNFNFANRAAVRKYRLMHLVVGDNEKPAGKIIRHPVACHFLSELEKVKAAIAFPRREPPIIEINMIGRSIQDGSSDTLSLDYQFPCGEREHCRRVPHGASGMSAASSFHNIGVAQNDADGLDRHRDKVRNHLRKARFVALTGRLGADNNLDAAIGAHDDARVFFRRTDGGFDIVGETETKKFAAFFGVPFARFEAVPIGKAHGEVHIVPVMATVVEHADGVPVGHRLRTHDIATPQGDPIDAQFFGRYIDEPFNGEGDFRTA